MLKYIFIHFLFSAFSLTIFAQQDSSLLPTSKVTLKYLQETNKKITIYTKGITSKTERTLEKLTKWENKIQLLVLKINPVAADQLFGNGKITFSSMLKKIQEGKAIVNNAQAKYDAYNDKITTNLKYLETQKNNLNTKYLKPLQNAKEKIKKLDEDVTEIEMVQTLIKERKKELLNEAYKLIGKSKYFKKINKESYYYIEALKEYKTIFNDEDKVEKLAILMLKKIPGFAKFTSENSLFAGLFGNFSLNSSSGNSVPIVNGVAPRSQVIQAILIGTNSGFNPTEMVNNQMPDVKSKLKNLMEGSGTADGEMPDFTPNNQKTKSFFKRLEYAADIQFGAANNYLPTTANATLTIGYKLNDKISAGAGMSYILGLGHGWNDLKLSSEGIGFRTYLKVKMKKGFSLQGGSEWNYNVHFKKITDLNKSSMWQQTELIGFGKTMQTSKKLKTDIKLLYDFLYNNHMPATQPFIFRVGYHF